MKRTAALALLLFSLALRPLAFGQAQFALAAAPELTLGYCGDALAQALDQDSVQAPCWAAIRTSQHWNTLSLAEGGTINGSRTFTLSTDAPSAFSYTLGGLAGSAFGHEAHGQAYTGVAAVSGLLERSRWKLMAEDGGGAGDYQGNSGQGASFVGLNRGAIRGLGDVGARWSWQASATNTFGNDVVRTFAPLDYAAIGNSEAPVPSIVAYGLHTGNVIAEQEDLRLTYADTRRTQWNFSVGHTFQHYAQDGFSSQTVGGRAEYLRSLTPNAALGFYGNAAHQTNSLDCTVAGVGVQGLFRLGTRSSINIEGGPSGASAGCGRPAQFLGSAAVYLGAGSRTDIYALANRDFSEGVLERAVFLSAVGAGVRYAITPGVHIRLTGAAIYGTDPKTNQSYDGTFSEAAVGFRLGDRFTQDLAFRHYQVAGGQVSDNRNLVVLTVWWSPNQNFSRH